MPPLFWLPSILDEKNCNWVEIIDTSRAQSLAALFMAQGEEITAGAGSRPANPIQSKRLGWKTAGRRRKQPGQGVRRNQQRAGTRDNNHCRPAGKDGNGGPEKRSSPTAVRCTPSRK